MLSLIVNYMHNKDNWFIGGVFLHSLKVRQLSEGSRKDTSKILAPPVTFIQEISIDVRLSS